MRGTVRCERAYEETPGVEGLGGLFSGFPEEGVGGGVYLGRNRVPLAGVENPVELILTIWMNIILRICIRRG